MYILFKEIRKGALKGKKSREVLALFFLPVGGGVGVPPQASLSEARWGWSRVGAPHLQR